MFLSKSDIQAVVKKKYYHLPFWLIVIGFLLFWKLYLFKYPGHLQTSTWTTMLLAIYKYFIMQLYVIAKYIKLLILPIGLCIDHRIAPAKTIFDFKTLASLILLAGIFISVYIQLFCIMINIRITHRNFRF